MLDHVRFVQELELPGTSRRRSKPSKCAKTIYQVRINSGLDLSINHVVHFVSLRRGRCLLGSEFRGAEEPYCWKGEPSARMTELLASHIIHPNKMTYSTVGVEFAQTVNQPAVGIAFAAHRKSCATEQASGCLDYNEGVVMPFWCPTRR